MLEPILHFGSMYSVWPPIKRTVFPAVCVWHFGRWTRFGQCSVKTTALVRKNERPLMHTYQPSLLMATDC